MIEARGTERVVFIFGMKKCISSKNRSVGLENIQNKEMLTNRGFTVIEYSNMTHFA